MKTPVTRHPSPVIAAAFAAALAAAGADAAEITLSGPYTSDYVYTNATEDTTVNLDGVVFSDCSLKLVGNKTFTINLIGRNVFTMDNANKELVKATKKSNIVFAGTGSAELTSTKRITDGGEPSGIVVCNNLTVEGGDITVTFDQNKSDTSCIFVKGNYLQTGGRVKVDMNKKNCTNEFAGVHLDTADTTFKLFGGEFRAEIAGTRSRAIDLKKSCTATFRDCDVSAKFEGPGGRFVSGGTLVFESGEYDFRTNITSKMTAAYHPTGLSAIKADYSITVSGGDFEADLPLADSEVFTTDSATGTFVSISGGTFDLVAGNDCIHANGDILFSGGTLRGVSGDDILDANGSMTISGGDIRAYATAPGTHGLDVNNKKTLAISGGIVVATDGLGATRIGTAGSSEVGSAAFDQPTYYGTLSTSGYSEKYLVLEGETNGVPFTIKPRLPAFPAGNDFNLLVSLPGRAASVPLPSTIEEAYSNANSRTPLVFERKASVSDHAITSKEGETLQIAEHYDISPATGKSKVFDLSLNELARPVYADPASDQKPAIEVDGDTVNVNVRTRKGLTYLLLAATALSTNAVWGVADSVAGDGTVRTLSADAGAAGFFKVEADD